MSITEQPASHVLLNQRALLLAIEQDQQKDSLIAHVALQTHLHRTVGDPCKWPPHFGDAAITLMNRRASE